MRSCCFVCQMSSDTVSDKMTTIINVTTKLRSLTAAAHNTYIGALYRTLHSVAYPKLSKVLKS